MRDLPSGTVTLLFTDIEGSTRLLRELGDAYVPALAEHRRLIREAFARHDGVEVDTQGDAFFVAFPSSKQAVAAAGEAQAALEAGPVRVRMGLHTGKPTLTEEGYVGLDVHLGARIAASGHGGQVILSSETRARLDDDTLPLVDLGEHRLKDFDEAVQVYQLGDRVFPPLKTISNTNLPRPASSFIGREREVADVLGLLRDSARLVTLTGPGGSGKTRLGIEVAAELVPEYRAGVFWIGLATVRDPAMVAQAIGQTLGAGKDVAKHVGEREMLLLLDNFEQVVEAAPDLSRLVESCPNLAVLVSSRELLRIRGEVEYPVPPMAPPEAVALFCARAHIPEPTEDIAELSARLDNLPLAVELAAARARVLSPGQILERLSKRLDMFKGGRDADPRQATLRATIAWSHDLLSGKEQRLFARLAVFAGGCTIGSAEAVCDADVDTMQSLVEKSLVRRTGDRFWMLETIREFAVERLEASGEADDMARRHYDYFFALAESASVSEETDRPQRMDLVLPEDDNFRAALDAATARGDIEAALRLVIRLELWASMRPFEGLRRVGSLLESATAIPDDLRARALRVLGGTRGMSGDQTGAWDAFQESLSIFRSLGQEADMAKLLNRLGVTATYLGRLEQARPLIEESLELSRRLPVPRVEAQGLTSLGDLEYRQGNHELGLELLERGAVLAGEMGYVWWQGVTLGILGEYALELGRFEQAERYTRNAIALLREVEDRQNTIYGLAILAWSAAAAGDGRRAGVLWGAIESEEGRAPIGAWDLDREKYVAAVAQASGPVYEEGRREGRRLSLGQAVDYAIGDDPDLKPQPV